MTAVSRLEGPRPGGTDGERASGTTMKIPSRWSGGYRDKYDLHFFSTNVS